MNTGGADGFFIISDVQAEENGLFQVSNNNITSKAGKSFNGKIEGTYLMPIIKDYTKKAKKIEIDGFDAYCLVLTHSHSFLKDKHVYEYIKWGEKQGYNQRSVTKSQKPWFKPTRQMLNYSQILVPRSFYDTHVIHFNKNNYLSLRFYRLHLKKGSAPLLLAFLNSTYMALIFETLGNRSLGQGVLDFFMSDFLNLRIPIIQNTALLKPFNSLKNRIINPIFTELGLNPNLPIRDQKPNPLPDRKVLDDVVFDILGLAQEEREEVYWSACELVKNRLEKARSV